MKGANALNSNKPCETNKPNRPNKADATVTNEQILERLDSISTTMKEMVDVFSENVTDLDARVTALEDKDRAESDRTERKFRYQQSQINALRDAISRLANDEESVVWRSNNQPNLIGIDREDAYDEFAKCGYTSTEALRQLETMRILKRGEGSHLTRKVFTENGKTRAVAIWIDRLD